MLCLTFLHWTAVANTLDRVGCNYSYSLEIKPQNTHQHTYVHLLTRSLIMKMIWSKTQRGKGGFLTKKLRVNKPHLDSFLNVTHPFNLKAFLSRMQETRMCNLRARACVCVRVRVRVCVCVLTGREIASLSRLELIQFVAATLPCW